MITPSQINPENRVASSVRAARIPGMRLMTVNLMIAIILFCIASTCHAQSDLLRLLPPDASVLAGMRRVPPEQARDALWLATRNNTGDLSGMIAATENDPGRRVDQVVVADWPSPFGELANHVAIASGRFTLPPLTASSGAQGIVYQGVPVLAVPETSAANAPVRWLAVPRRDLALYGTPAAVRYALDRYRSGAPAAPQLLARVDHADARNSSAWSSLRLDSRRLLSRVSLPTDGESLVRCMDGIRELDLAIHIGGTVKIDLHANPQASAIEGVSTGCLATAFFGTGSLHKRVVVDGDEQHHLRVSLAHADYDEWLDSFRASRTSQLLMAMISTTAQSPNP